MAASPVTRELDERTDRDERRATSGPRPRGDPGMEVNADSPRAKISWESSINKVEGQPCLTLGFGHHPPWCWPKLFLRFVLDEANEKLAAEEVLYQRQVKALPARVVSTLITEPAAHARGPLQRAASQVSQLHLPTPARFSL